MKLWQKILAAVVVLIAVVLVIYPNIVIDTGDEYDNGIFYKLDDRYEEMWVFYVDDLLVIQVGSPDELPKFIAYK